jgi:hypothetical protein
MSWNHTSNLAMANILHFAIILSFDDQCDSSTMFVTCIAYHDQNLIIVIMLLSLILQFCENQENNSCFGRIAQIA